MRHALAQLPDLLAELADLLAELAALPPQVLTLGVDPPAELTVVGPEAAEGSGDRGENRDRSGDGSRRPRPSGQSVEAEGDLEEHAEHQDHQANQQVHATAESLDLVPEAADVGGAPLSGLVIGAGRTKRPVRLDGQQLHGTIVAPSVALPRQSSATRTSRPSEDLGRLAAATSAAWRAPAGDWERARRLLERAGGDVARATAALHARP